VWGTLCARFPACERQLIGENWHRNSGKKIFPQSLLLFSAFVCACKGDGNSGPSGRVGASRVRERDEAIDQARNAYAKVEK